MTLDQLKFQREALQEQLELVEFRIKQLEQAQAQCTEQREHRDQYLRSEPKPKPFWEQR